MMKYLLLSLPLLLMACGSPDTERQETPVQPEGLVSLSKAGFEMAGIKTAVIESGTITQTVRCLGQIDMAPGKQSSVSLVLPGRIQSILVEEGQYVRKGQVLFTVADPAYIELQKEFLVCGNELDRKEKEYARHNELFSSGAMAAKDFQQSKAEFENLRAEAASLRLKLDMLGIDRGNLNTTTMTGTVPVRSAISGQVNDIMTSLGEYIEGGKTICTITASEGFRVVCHVFEKDISLVRKGQTMILKCNIPGSLDSIHLATVSSVSSVVEEGSRTFRVYARPDKAYEGLRSGLAVQAEIETGETRGLVVSKEAIAGMGGREGVFIALSDTAFRFHPIGEYNEQGDNVILRDASLEGKTIVVKGAYYLASTVSE